MTDQPIDDSVAPAQQDEQTAESLLQLDPQEARVLGALMEKQRTTPESYPLTQNALVNACNQKTSREPVMNMSPGEVGYTLRTLESRGLVRTESGSRSERYAQRLGHALGLNDKRQALLALLLLRGPQTLSELLTRSARLAEFRDAEELHLSVLKLIERPQPLVVQLATQAGQREARYMHLLSGEVSAAATTHENRPSVSAPATAEATTEIAELRARVEQLETALAAIQQELGLSVAGESTDATPEEDVL